MSTKIEWTDETWNILTGCTRVSPGCENCYAERLAATRLKNHPRYQGVARMTEAGPRFTGEVRMHPELLEVPLRWRKPRMIFVSAQSDLFHPDVPFEFVDKVFAVMALGSHHVFQCLTKRPERMADYLSSARPRVAPKGHFGHLQPANLEAHLAWPLPNVWLGTSVEDQQRADERIPHLLRCPVAVRFLSCEPLLGPVDLSRWIHPPEVGEIAFSTVETHPVGARCEIHSDLLHWAIVGGESGPGARPMHPEWARSLRDQCVDADVAFFFKQWGEWAPADHNLWMDNDLAVDRGGSSRPWTDDWVETEVKMRRAGKKKAGRELDGRTWDQMPSRTNQREANIG